MLKTVMFMFNALLILATVISVSNQEFIKALPDEEHYNNNGLHNKEYDHKAFLGPDANSFEHLSPEESKLRLGLIVDKIDENKNGYVSREELTDWIRYTQSRYITNDVDTQWRTHNPQLKLNITWDEYRKSLYGFSHDSEADKLDAESEEGAYSYRKMLLRDQRRWTAADANADGVLDRQEFAAFLHPEESDHMRDLVVMETIADMDKNEDGLISLNEYIGDLYHQYDPNNSTDENMPHWVSSEKLHFTKYRDKNGDGFMDHGEVREWITPRGFDHAISECRHLIHEADVDMDDLLTKQEILDKYDVFVSSQVTDFGEALMRHDEL